MMKDGWDIHKGAGQVIPIGFISVSYPEESDMNVLSIRRPLSVEFSSPHRVANIRFVNRSSSKTSGNAETPQCTRMKHVRSLTGVQPSAVYVLMDHSDINVKEGNEFGVENFARKS